MFGSIEREPLTLPTSWASSTASDRLAAGSSSDETIGIEGHDHSAQHGVDLSPPHLFDGVQRRFEVFDQHLEARPVHRTDLDVRSTLCQPRSVDAAARDYSRSSASPVTLADGLRDAKHHRQSPDAGSPRRRPAPSGRLVLGPPRSPDPRSKERRREDQTLGGAECGAAAFGSRRPPPSWREAPGDSDRPRTQSDDPQDRHLQARPPPSSRSNHSRKTSIEPPLRIDAASFPSIVRERSEQARGRRASNDAKSR